MCILCKMEKSGLILIFNEYEELKEIRDKLISELKN